MLPDVEVTVKMIGTDTGAINWEVMRLLGNDKKR